MGKLPEIQKAEDAVVLLLKKRNAAQEVWFRTHVLDIFVCCTPSTGDCLQLLMDFALSDQVFAKAKVPVTYTVNLWLGANVMLEYTLEDAKDILVCRRYIDCLLLRSEIRCSWALSGVKQVNHKQRDFRCKISRLVKRT